jgi:hypothetical protein
VEVEDCTGFGDWEDVAVIVTTSVELGGSGIPSAASESSANPTKGDVGSGFKIV